MRQPALLQNNLVLWLNAFWFLAGLLFWNWRPDMVLLVYIFETIVLGVLTLLQLSSVVFLGKQYNLNLSESIRTHFTSYEWEIVEKLRLPLFLKFMYNLFIVGMFGVVFLGFIWIQSVFVFLLLSKVNPLITDDPLGTCQNFAYLFSQKDFIQAFAGIVVAHLVYMVRFLFTGTHHFSVDLSSILRSPLLRIFVQQVVMVVGSFLFFIFQQNLILVAVVLILLKTGVETMYNNKNNTQSFSDKLG